MKIRKIMINGFGKLTDRSYTFSDGLNVIYGNNEAGKSTLHRFIGAVFYGFFKPYSKNRQYTPDIDRYKPWNTERYSGSITAHLLKDFSSLLAGNNPHGLVAHIGLLHAVGVHLKRIHVFALHEVELGGIVEPLAAQLVAHIVDMLAGFVQMLLGDVKLRQSQGCLHTGKMVVGLIDVTSRCSIKIVLGNKLL